VCLASGLFGRVCVGVWCGRSERAGGEPGRSASNLLTRSPSGPAVAKCPAPVEPGETGRGHRSTAGRCDVACTALLFSKFPFVMNDAAGVEVYAESCCAASPPGS
jgi:hypothetical protein